MKSVTGWLVRRRPATTIVASSGRKRHRHIGWVRGDQDSDQPKSRGAIEAVPGRAAGAGSPLVARGIILVRK